MPLSPLSTRFRVPSLPPVEPSSKHFRARLSSEDWFTASAASEKALAVRLRSSPPAFTFDGAFLFDSTNDLMSLTGHEFRRLVPVRVLYYRFASPDEFSPFPGFQFPPLRVMEFCRKSKYSHPYGSVCFCRFRELCDGDHTAAPFPFDRAHKPRLLYFRLPIRQINPV